MLRADHSTSARWIGFDGPTPSQSGKTKIWKVVTDSSVTIPATVLGEVRWFGRWRCYAFFPEPSMVFEHACLRDLAAFCEAQTAEHKRAANG